MAYVYVGHTLFLVLSLPISAFGTSSFLIDDWFIILGWLLKLLARQNRKLGRSVDHLQKRKPFIRLSFGEKHEIAKYITQFPDKTYPEYARYFSELWNRTVTAR